VISVWWHWICRPPVIVVFFLGGGVLGNMILRSLKGSSYAPPPPPAELAGADENDETPIVGVFNVHSRRSLPLAWGQRPDDTSGFVGAGPAKAPYPSSTHASFAMFANVPNRRQCTS